MVFFIGFCGGSNNCKLIVWVFCGGVVKYWVVIRIDCDGDVFMGVLILGFNLLIGLFGRGICGRGVVRGVFVRGFRIFLCLV